MKPALFSLLILWSCAAAPLGAEGADAAPEGAVKIRPKAEPEASSAGESPISLLQPDTDLIDAPSSAVLDYGGYSARTRFFSTGGVLQYISFGVFNRLNIGASLNIDKFIGREKPTRVRSPNVQVKYRFYEGTRTLPSLAFGYDGQGWLYNQGSRRYNQRQRGFFVAATQELGLPGLQLHPSLNISDFDTNSIFAALPLSLNIQDKVNLMLEWDAVNNFLDSRLNAALRVYLTSAVHVDFALRSIGQGALFSDGTPRGPERVVQIKYSGNF